MRIKLSLALLFFAFSVSFSQQLTYKGGGRIYNSGNEKLSPTQVRELFRDKPGILSFYNAGRSKKTIGNVMMIGGGILLASDLLIGLKADHQYPGALTYIGAASVLLAIPIKIGFSKKIRIAVDDYNKLVGYADPISKSKAVDLCINSNGIGMLINF